LNFETHTDSLNDAKIILQIPKFATNIGLTKSPYGYEKQTNVDSWKSKKIKLHFFIPLPARLQDIFKRINIFLWSLDVAISMTPTWLYIWQLLFFQFFSSGEHRKTTIKFRLIQNHFNMLVILVYSFYRLNSNLNIKMFTRFYPCFRFIANNTSGAC
jgi:hypothetical protein